MEAKKDQDNGNGQAKARREEDVGGAGNGKEPNTEPASPAVGGRPPRDELTSLQLRGIHALLTQPTMAAAAAEIDAHSRTVSRWMKGRAFRAEYLAQMTELQAELWRQMLSVRTEVWNRYLELMRSNDEKVALRATTWFLDKVLSVPAFLSQISLEEDVFDPGISPSLRTLLAEAEVVERGNEDDAA